MTLHLSGGGDNPYETAGGLSYMQLRLGYLTTSVHASVQASQTI